MNSVTARTLLSKIFEKQSDNPYFRFTVKNTQSNFNEA
jgi:hypothetical protein